VGWKSALRAKSQSSIKGYSILIGRGTDLLYLALANRRLGFMLGFMRFKPMVARWAIVVSCLWLQASHADDRIWVPAKINGKRARLGFDTGAGAALLLSPAAAQRLGLKFTAPPTMASIPPGKVPRGVTEECVLRLWGHNVKAQFGVVDWPDYLHVDFDGLIGWRCISSNILQINAGRQKVAFLSKLPKKVATWTKIPLRTNSAILHLELSQGGKTNEIVEVDTGDPVGVALNPDKWREWKASHPKQPLTLRASFMHGSGLMVKEEAWAGELLLGPLVLTGVPVTEATPTQVALGTPQFGASLGMAALKRLDLIVDGRHGVAYLRPKTTRPPAYGHNRSGAIFVPANPQSDGLVAHVLDGSPAYEAGVRNGDVLLRVGKVDVSHWRTDPRIHPNGAFYRRPGAKIDLTLQRGNETYKATVILREILAPEPAKP
jgi:hypothetical protein